VQTSWPDGTVLQDYSNANTGTATVYGGGKVNISIPPCNGTAPQGRRGYSIWAPVGIAENYSQPIKRITQEWEMAEDLGDKHNNSLQQSGRLPDNSEVCRQVGKIYVEAGADVLIDLFPENSDLSITLFLEDANCNMINTITQTGEINHIYTPNTSGWINIKVKNTTDNQAGQKCWVKVNYQAPLVVVTNVPKQKCACQVNTAATPQIEQNNIFVYPNPTRETLKLELGGNLMNFNAFTIHTLDGRNVAQGGLASHYTNEIDVKHLQSGVYLFVLQNGNDQQVIRFVKE
jgi:alpha-amylase